MRERGRERRERERGEREHELQIWRRMLHKKEKKDRKRKWSGENHNKF